MKIITIKAILIFSSVVLLCLVFPMQVMSSSKMLALLPYLPLCGALLLTRLQEPHSFQLCWNARKPIMFFISIYLALVFVTTAWQAAFDLITPTEGVSVILNFTLPVVFFVYFRTMATEQEFRAIFIAMIVAGFATGIYFVYDSYALLVLKNVNTYSFNALEYMKMRAPSVDFHDTRITPNYRSHGLLESHTVSAGWIVLACFAALTLLPKNQYKIRLAVILLFGTMLLIGLNLTSMFGFAFVIILMEFEGYKLFFGSISKKLFKLPEFIFSGFILIVFTLFILPDSIGMAMLTEIINIFDTQTKILSGAINVSEGHTFVGDFISDSVNFLYPGSYFHLSILFGDGFSSFGAAKGGNYGVIENCYRFGLLFYLCIIVGLLRLITRALKKVGLNDLNILSASEGYLWFAVALIIYLIVADLHYSIWPTKSFLPLLFVSLAIFDRYLDHQSQG